MIERLENLVFDRRAMVIALFAVVTVLLLGSASRLRVDAGFNKLLPLEHEYMQTFVHYREFGGANRILIALLAREGDIFTPAFFAKLREVTDAVFFLPGVDRTQVHSLFTPNVRFTEVVEDGISGGNVIPGDFEPTAQGLEQVRENILKAGIVGRLVANDFTGAIVSAKLHEIDPGTGERLDYIEVAHALEAIREKLETDAGPELHIIGFAKVVGDIADGAGRVVEFFGIAFLLTAVFVFLYAQSVRLTIVALGCSLIAVIWQLGLLAALGFGIDPMSILVPFLVFAIGVSHGVQMVSAVQAEVLDGASRVDAARASFRGLVVPGGIALASDAIGFVTISLIEIRIIQEMAVTASLGVAAIILTNLVLLPVLLSYAGYRDADQRSIAARIRAARPLWRLLAQAAQRGPGSIIVALALGLTALGAMHAGRVEIGDLQRGVPELRAESVYNQDSQVIGSRFSIGVDVLSVIAETIEEGCIDYGVMSTIDEFEWHMQNVRGVQSVLGLPGVARVINAGWNEGSLKWRVLPRNQSMLVQSVAYVPTSSGLLNTDCSVMPVLVFTADHKAETIARIVAAVKDFQTRPGTDRVNFRLAAGNIGVMAATNEEVEASQFPILLYVYAAVTALCVLTFRSIPATLCIVLPLGLVSLLAYALMAALEIGLKVSTLPVVALGVGIGVDYGIYVYARLSTYLERGLPLPEAYEETLCVTGTGVVFTGLTLAIGVATWIFAPLKFQADMGVLLTFMFLLNMLGAIVLLPALGGWLIRKG